MKVIGGKEQLNKLRNEFWSFTVEKCDVTAKLAAIGINVKFIENDPIIMTSDEFEAELNELMEDFPECDE